LVKGFLVDTSVLRVFSSIQRLDLLNHWAPLLVTKGIVREHGQAPPHARKHLDAILEQKAIEIAKPPKEDTTKLSLEDPRLSPVDWEGVCVARRDNLAILVADKKYRDECKARGIRTVGVATLLHSLRRDGVITEEQMTAIANQMVKAGYYAFSPVEEESLGLSGRP